MCPFDGCWVYLQQMGVPEAKRPRLTWSRGLLGHWQRHLRERQDVDVRAVLGGRRGQGGHVCVVLVPLRIVELLESRRIQN